MLLEGFDDIEMLKKEYEITDAELEGFEILYAAYNTGFYDGVSIVLLKKNDKFFIVDAGHCSCYGLEGSWCPIETNEAALKKEIEAKDNYHYEEFSSFIEFCYHYFKWEKK